MAQHATAHMVRYTVKPDEAAHDEQLVRAVFAELDDARPAGLRYATFRLADGVTFIHLIAHDRTEHGPAPRLQALRDLHAGIRARCDEAPIRVELTEIGSYRLFTA